MNFRKVNNITGWAIFLVAFATYFLTREARGSLWDCGEFVASAAKVQLPHPPGAPMFVLLGRFFIILFGDNGQTAASAVNFMSGLASAATILFLFWTITHFARKMFVNAGEALTGQQTLTVMGAGAIGALAYTFSDSFWYSAVEGEVYALSSFFTALVFWAMLKWEHADEHAGTNTLEKTRADRWIVFLFFMVGLSIGVHLLNLLTIPAIVMIYYYRRYRPTTKGAIWAFIIGCIITGVVQVGVIQYSMKAAGLFDVLFVNSFGMPFFSGFAIYFIALAALIIWALRFNERNISKTTLAAWFVLFLLLSLLPFVFSSGSGGSKFLKFILVAGVGIAAAYLIKPGALRIVKLSLWCYAFIMLGYFMYFTALIRSNANPAIDMNNVDNPVNLVYYLSREQYGSAPLVYGPHFLADVKRDEMGYAQFKEGEMRYVKGEDRYIEIGRQPEYEYESKDKQLFPRIWDPSNDQFHFDTYIDWLNLPALYAQEYAVISDAREGYIQTQNQEGKTQQFTVDDNYSIRVRRGQMVSPGEKLAIKVPSYGDNFRWFFTYQNGFMYWRYFMWNFAGRQNDIQGTGNRRDGNWITGISFMDNQRLGDQAKMPESIRENKAHNKFFLLPFILGIVGCVYQFLRNRRDWIVSFLLFFLTGVGVVLYLNQPGSQPRERDYAYVGSFYAFAIWIGLSIVGFVRMAREKEDKQTFKQVLSHGAVLTFLVMAMSTANETFGPVVMTALFGTILYVAVAAAITYLVRTVSSQGQNSRVLNIATIAIAAIIPLIMVSQTWNDHDRSTKTLAPDLARNYLESCAPNAIIFTYGDNDTYPLWYAQEVEGVRPDIRIINNSLLGIDWYINQLRYKINQADPVDVIWTKEQIEGNNRAQMYYQAAQGINPNTFYPLYDAMKNVLGKTEVDPETGRDVGSTYFPVKKFSIPVDMDLVRKNGTVSAADSGILNEIQFEIPRNVLQRNDFMILNIIAANRWQRPIYFTAPVNELGFGEYLRKDGLAYRLVPVKNTNRTNNWVINTGQRDPNLDAMYANLMNKFVFDSRKGTYYDEENRRHVLNIRNTYAEAAGNLADAGKKQEALQVLDRAEKLIDLPYAMVSRGNAHNINGLAYLEAAYKAGRMDLAQKVKAALKKDFEEQKAYYDYLKAEREDLFAGFDGQQGEAARNEYFMSLLGILEKRYEPNAATTPGTTEGPNSIQTGPARDSNRNDTNR